MLKHKLIILAIVILVMSIVWLGVSDSKASTADTSISNDEVISSEADNSDSASATITITMYALPDD